MVGHDGNTEDLAAVRMMLEVEKAKCSRTWDKLADFQTPAALNWGIPTGTGDHWR